MMAQSVFVLPASTLTMEQTDRQLNGLEVDHRTCSHPATRTSSSDMGLILCDDDDERRGERIMEVSVLCTLPLSPRSSASISSRSGVAARDLRHRRR